MRYENQVLFDKGLSGLAYQLEALMDKAPELADDFDNLTTLIKDVIDEAEDKETEAFDKGHDEGYAEAEWDNSGKYDEGFDDGRQEGYEDGFEEGRQEGYEAGIDEGYEDGLAEGQSACE